MIQRRVPPLIRTELALVIIGLSLVAPRLAGWGPQAVAVETSPESSQAAVGYAQHRLWYDFLDRRAELGRGNLPDPTLAEYRAFLAGLGLHRRGDRCELVVLSDMESANITDRITIRLTDSRTPIRLDVSVEEGDATKRAGRLEIRANADDQVSCFVEAAQSRTIWSIWPLRPQPLLP